MGDPGRHERFAAINGWAYKRQCRVIDSEIVSGYTLNRVWYILSLYMGMKDRRQAIGIYLNPGRIWGVPKAPSYRVCGRIAQDLCKNQKRVYHSERRVGLRNVRTAVQRNAEAMP